MKKIFLNLALTLAVTVTFIKITIPVNVKVEIQRLHEEMKFLKAELIIVKSLVTEKISTRSIRFPGGGSISSE